MASFFPMRLLHIFMLPPPYHTAGSLKAVKELFTKYLLGSGNFHLLFVFSKSRKVIMYYHSHFRDGKLGFRRLENLPKATKPINRKREM